MKLLNLLIGGDSASSDQLLCGSCAESADGIKRNALQQAFGVDMCVKKTCAPRVEGTDHFYRGEGSRLAPTANGDFAFFGIDGKNQLVSSNFGGNVLRESYVNFPIAN